MTMKKNSKEIREKLLKARALSNEELEKVSGGTAEGAGYSNFVVYINETTLVVIIKKISTNEIRTFTFEEYSARKNLSWMW